MALTINDMNAIPNKYWNKDHFNKDSNDEVRCQEYITGKWRDKLDKVKSMRYTISVSGMEEEDLKIIKKIAEKEKRSVSFIIKELIKVGLSQRSESI